VAGWRCDLPGGYGIQAGAPLLDGILRGVAMFAAVLSLEEVVRSRRALERGIACWPQSRNVPSSCCSTCCPPRSQPDSRPARRSLPTGFPMSPCCSPNFVDFTRGSERVDPAAVLKVLNELFSAFDELARHCGLEKMNVLRDIQVRRLRRTPTVEWQADAYRVSRARR
jgi:hypothetical protein